MAKNWYSITAFATKAHIYLFDEIGAYGVTAKSFVKDLQSVAGKDLELHINSPGGDMFEATAIYNALVAHRGQVTAIVEGVACSAASFVAMAANHIVMPANALLMIHDPSAAIVGGAKDLRGGAQLLDNITTSMIAAYVAKTGLSEDRVAALMAAETWFTAEEAHTLGFADEVRDAVKVAASFDLSRRFQKAPRPVATPKSMNDAGLAYWAARKGKPAPAGDVSDLIPPPITAEKAFANFHGRFARRRK